MKDGYVHVSAFKDLLCDIYNVMNRLDYTMEHTGYGAAEFTTMEWIERKLKDTIEKAEMQVENAEPGEEPETESTCGDCRKDVREALGLSGAKKAEAKAEDQEALSAFSIDLLKERLDELKTSASERSVSDSISKEERACYQAKEEAYETALTLIEVNMAWQRKLAGIQEMLPDEEEESDEPG